jgi:hypothetical protein
MPGIGSGKGSAHGKGVQDEMLRGEMISDVLQNQNGLGLTAEQQARLGELQSTVEKKISSILTKEQRVRYKEMKRIGPGSGPAVSKGASGSPADRGAGRPKKVSEKGDNDV